MESRWDKKLRILAVLEAGDVYPSGVIRGLTAEGRLQALILMALPPLLLALMLIVNRDYAQLLLERPILLVGMGVFMGLGALWIRKIVNFDF